MNSDFGKVQGDSKETIAICAASSYTDGAGCT